MLLFKFKCQCENAVIVYANSGSDAELCSWDDMISQITDFLHLKPYAFLM